MMTSPLISPHQFLNEMVLIIPNSTKPGHRISLLLRVMMALPLSKISINSWSLHPTINSPHLPVQKAILSRKLTPFTKEQIPGHQHLESIGFMAKPFPQEPASK